MGSLLYGARRIDAFPGAGAHRNRAASACIGDAGPTPPGRYDIIDRQSGGTLGWFRDMFSGRGAWFALHADDGLVDDQTPCNRVQRGQFRLHPKGPLGLSLGCVVVDQADDFAGLRATLRAAPRVPVPKAGLQAYGVLVVSG